VAEGAGTDGPGTQNRLAVEKRLVDQFPVQSVVNGLAHPNIVKGRLVGIQAQVVHGSHLRSQVSLARGFDFFALVDRYGSHHIRFARQQRSHAGRFFGNGLKNNLLVGGLGTVVLVIGFEDDLLALGPLHQFVGPATDRLDVIVGISHLLHHFRGNDGEIVPQDVEARRIGFSSGNGDGMLIQDLEILEGG